MYKTDSRGMDLLDEIMDFIRMHPEEHSQTDFVRSDAECGTTFCVAGHALIASGKYGIGNAYPWGRSRFVNLLNPRAEVFPSDVARDLLGLTERQADLLFFTAQDFSDVEAVYKAIKNEESSVVLTYGDPDIYEERSLV